MKIYILFAYISFVLYGSFAEPHGNVESVCLLPDPSNQCGHVCLTALKPMMDHIALQQDKWSIWGAAKVNETQSKLDRIEGQQASVAESLSKLETSMEVKNSACKGFESRLNKFESEQNKLKSEQALILKELSRMSKKLTLLKFKLIGTRYFYIEDSIEQSWISAERSCGEMGGHLASFQNEEEFDAIQGMLGYNRWYWVGISDRDRSGQYVSVASGRSAPYLEWGGFGDPDDRDHSHNCVLIGRRKMWDSGCNEKNLFICQADDII